VSALLRKIPVSLGEQSYEIVIGYRILNELGEALSKLGLGPKQMIITSELVQRLYCKAAYDSLLSSGFDASVTTVSDDEKAKSLDTLTTIYEKLLEHEFDRSSGIVALGGGVVGDMAGFAAATFMRGIRFAQVPTTLLAQIDSSIGGKTGVNHPRAKNLIGAFHQPAIVWTDISTLQTLPNRELRSGLAETIKYAMIADPELFKMLEKTAASLSSTSHEALIDIISRCCMIKARLVEQDEKERGARSILNYGHTVGHALETITGYSKYTHGEAIAIGMIAATRISHEIGAADDETMEQQERLLRTAGLPTRIEQTISAQAIIGQLNSDKKRLGGRIRWVLPRTIGDAFLTMEVRPDVVLKVLKQMTTA